MADFDSWKHVMDEYDVKALDSGKSMPINRTAHQHYSIQTRGALQELTADPELLKRLVKKHRMEDDRISACVSHGTTNLGDSTEDLLPKKTVLVCTALVSLQRQHRTHPTSKMPNLSTSPESPSREPCDRNKYPKPQTPNPKPQTLNRNPGCTSCRLPNAKGVRHRQKPWMRLRQALCQGSLRSSPWVEVGGFRFVRKARVDL